MILSVKRPFTIIIALLLTLPACSTDQEKKLVHFNKARQYSSRNEYKAAIIEYKNAIQIDPSYVDAYKFLGDAYLQLENPEEAFLSYSKAEELLPQDPSVLICLAKLYMLDNNFEQAEGRIQKILQNAPDHIDALFLLATLLTAQNTLNRASVVFEKILTIDKNHLNSLLELARIKEAQEDLPGAEKLLLQATEVSPDKPRPRLALISFYIHHMNVPKARHQIVQLENHLPSTADSCTLIGHCYQRLQQMDQAEVYLKKACQMAPDTPATHLFLAKLYNENNQKKKALELIQTILSEWPNHYPSRILEANILVEEKRFRKALDTLSELDLEGERDPRFHYIKAIALMGIKDEPGAITSFENVLTLHPNHDKSKQMLIELCYKQHRFGRVSELALDILDSDPDNYYALLNLSKAQLALKQVQDAENGFERLIRINPENDTGYYWLALINSGRKSYDKVETLLEKAYQINENSLDVLFLRVKNNIAQKHYTKARQLCVQRLDRHSDTPQTAAMIHA
ncbi:MAG: tetratricopeptide repeat protein, partial [Desulfobacteraceae bacterium]